MSADKHIFTINNLDDARLFVNNLSHLANYFKYCPRYPLHYLQALHPTVARQLIPSTKNC